MEHHHQPIFFHWIGFTSDGRAKRFMETTNRRAFSGMTLYKNDGRPGKGGRKPIDASRVRPATVETLVQQFFRPI